MKCIFLLVFILAIASTSGYSSVIPVCGEGAKTELGWRVRISAPSKGSIRKFKDIDYESFAIEFREKNSRFVLDGIFGPLATSGRIPKDWLSNSEPAIKSTWHDEIEVIDGRGQLPNGHYWRYVGTYGNSISYYDVTKKAADYFDRILDTACFK